MRWIDEQARWAWDTANSVVAAGCAVHDAEYCLRRDVRAAVYAVTRQCYGQWYGRQPLQTPGTHASVCHSPSVCVCVSMLTAHLITSGCRCSGAPSSSSIYLLWHYSLESRDHKYDTRHSSGVSTLDRKLHVAHDDVLDRHYKNQNGAVRHNSLPFIMYHHLML